MVEADGAKILAKACGEIVPPPELTLWVLADAGEVGKVVAVLHNVGEALIVFVTVPAPEYAKERDDAPELQTLDATSDAVSLVIWCKPGCDMDIDEPDARVTVKLLPFTVIDCTTALVPVTLNVYPPACMTALVVRVRSL